MTLKTAVVGGGAVAAVHLSGLQAHSDVDLRAVCDSNESRAGDRAAEYDVRAYGDFEGMLALESLDWIHLCTPVGTHAEHARMALEDDLAIQIESPLTDAAAAAEDLSALAAEGDGRVSVVHEGAFDPAVFEATNLIREGAIGDVRTVDLLYAGAPRPDDVGDRAWLADLAGGAFEERLARPVSQLLRLGGYPQSVDAIDASASLSRSYDGAFDYDGATFQYTTADGVHCSATVVASDDPQRVVRVNGDRGRLLVDLQAGTVTRRDRSGEESLVTGALTAVDTAASRLRRTATTLVDAARGSAGNASAGRDERDGRLEQIDREARALVADDPFPVPLSAGVWGTHVMQAVRDDASVGETVVSVAPEIDAA